MFKLISATPSPYARKVRIALQEKGLPFELVTEAAGQHDVDPKMESVGEASRSDRRGWLRVYSPAIFAISRIEVPRSALLPKDVDGKLEARLLLFSRCAEFAMRSVLTSSGARADPSQP
jgi:glutathione S-transferase